MIYFFNPYSFEKKLFKAYDLYMNLIGMDDWGCFTDGDTCFFENNFGHQVKDYIEKYPDTGIFTSYASRCGYKYMVPQGTDQDSDSIKYHRNRSADIFSQHHGEVKELDEHIAGHLICIKKSTWLMIRDELLKVCDGSNLLGVDTQISNVVRSYGLKIRLMKGIYLFHYYRLAEGKSFKQHLIDQQINVLIRTSNREDLFKRCLASVRNQTHKDINILVSADNESTAVYVRELGLDPVMVKKGIKSETETAPYNAYLNNLIAQVKGGWIFILDDDDYLIDKQIFEKLSKYLIDDNAIYLIRMRWANGRIIPSEENFGEKKFVRRDIGMPCFIFHAKHKHKIAFRPVKQGDFDFVSRLGMIIKRKNWLNIIVTQIGNTGLYGKSESKSN